MSDTIAALATPPLSGAIGIIRISGSQALPVAQTVFRLKKGKSLESAPARSLLLGNILLGDVLLDEACAFWMVAPYSYTGETMVELHLHGGLPVLQSTLDALYQAGARPAAPGEFTKRAFLHGKISLSQAEAVMDIITAETKDAARNAAGQLAGKIGKAYFESYNQLADMLAHFYALVDYPEEDLPPAHITDMQNTLTHCHARLSGLLSTYDRGGILREGVRCAIVGKPNAGKSSLLNAILGYNRALVSPLPGTTRDMIEESVLLGGIKLRLCDSAGIRKDADGEIESEGIDRALALARDSELLMVVLDGSEPLGTDDRSILDLARDKHCIVLVNKSDLFPKLEREVLEAAFLYVLPVSAKTGEGLDAVDSTLRRMYDSGAALYDGSVLTNARQADALRRTVDGIARAQDAFRAGMPPDAVLAELELSLSALGELTGRRVNEDIINKIFERFCVGK